MFERDILLPKRKPIKKGCFCDFCDLNYAQEVDEHFAKSNFEGLGSLILDKILNLFPLTISLSLL